MPTFAVVTKVNMEGNLASMLTDLYLPENPLDPDKYVRAADNPETFGLALHARAPVFCVGEVLILDEVGGREIPAPGRKPSKWWVDVEHFQDLGEALERSRTATEENEA